MHEHLVEETEQEHGSTGYCASCGCVVAGGGQLRLDGQLDCFPCAGLELVTIVRVRKPEARDDGR